MIDKRKTKSGELRYEVRYRAPDGRERSKTFRLKKDAEQFERSQRTDLARGTWVDPRGGVITFDAWAAEWLEIDATKRAKTRWRDEQTIRNHLSPRLGPRPIGTIKPTDVQAIVKGWVQAGLAPSTVRRHYATLRAILTAAVNADLLGRSPCRGVKLPSIEKADHMVLGPDEVAGIALEVGSEWAALVYVGAVLGLRWSEVAALKVGRLDLLRGTVTVAESLHEVRGLVVTEAPKSGASRRTFTMPSALTSMLAEHLHLNRLTGADVGAYVFSASDGSPLRYSNWMARVWRPACARAGLAGVGFHDLRRAAATAMVASGVDMKTAQERLGHSDPRLTLGLYAQATGAGDRAAADKLGAHFMNPARAEASGASSTSRLGEAPHDLPS